MVGFVGRKRIKKKNIMKIFLIIAILAIVVFLAGISELLKEPVVEETTTTIETTVKTTTTEEVTTTIEETTITTTSIPFVEHECKYLQYKIKSYKYENETLIFYLWNTGSIHIYNFVIILAYPDNIEEKAFYDVDIEPKEKEKFTTDVLPGLDNVTVYVPGCSYNIIDHLFKV